MITLTGNFLPNLEYFYRNANTFQYPKSGTPDIVVGKGQHFGSGTIGGTGLLSLSLYPTEYHIEIGSRSRINYFFKDLNSGSDNSSVDFGGSLSYLSGTDWVLQDVE